MKYDRWLKKFLIVALLAVTAAAYQNCNGFRPKDSSNSSQTISSQAKTLLNQYCANCHGTRSSGSGGFRFVLNHELLLSSGFLIPGDADGSKLFQRIADGSMPRGMTMSEAEIATLREWITSGAEAFEPETELRPVPVAPDSDEDILNLIYADLTEVPANERQFTRYLTFHHLHNAGLYAAQSATFEKGLNKLLNSLSWQPTVSRVTSLNLNKTVYKVVLTDFGFAETFWTQISSSYPYLRHPSNATYQSKLSALTTLSGGEDPIVRGDWFLQALSTPPLYQAALNLPANLAALETRLQVNTNSNLMNGTAIRAGFVSSFASINNRIIERHDLQAGRSYWKSFEFQDNIGRHNVLQFPLGPQSAEPVNFFESEGGEAIFDLPNGFHGYYIYDNGGNLQNQPNPALIINPANNRNFVLGLSCFSCHSTGVNSNTDVTRNYILGGNTFSGNRDQILNLYPGNATLVNTFNSDIQKFTTTLATLGIAANDPEPVSTSVAVFEESLTLARAAAEHGVTTDRLRTYIQNNQSLPAPIRELLNENARVSRSNFQTSFQIMAAGLQ